MIKTVIFDFDGVLVESVDIKTNAFARLFEREGKDVVRQVVDYHLKHTGVSRFEKFRYFYNFILKRDLTKEEFDGLCNRFSRLVVEEVVKAPYVKGAKEFLDINRTDYKYFVVSATPQEEMEGIIRKRDMGSYFDGIHGAPEKKSDAVRVIIRDNELLKDEVVFIGDAMSDYEAATASGIRFIVRISNNESIFRDIDSPKISDLLGLKDILSGMN